MRTILHHHIVKHSLTSVHTLTHSTLTTVVTTVTTHTMRTILTFLNRCSHTHSLYMHTQHNNGPTQASNQDDQQHCSGNLDTHTSDYSKGYCNDTTHALTQEQSRWFICSQSVLSPTEHVVNQPRGQRS